MSPGLAAVLSFLVPGLGQIAVGRIGRGVGFLGGVALCMILAAPTMLVSGFAGVGVWVWAVFDAAKCAEKAKKSAIAKQRQRRVSRFT